MMTGKPDQSSDKYFWSTAEQSDGAAKVMAVAHALAASYGGTVEFVMGQDGQYTASFAFPDTVSKEKETECAAKLEQAIVNLGGEVV